MQKKITVIALPALARLLLVPLRLQKRYTYSALDWPIVSPRLVGAACERTFKNRGHMEKNDKTNVVTQQ